MSRHLSGVDHVVVLVKDLATAADQYRKLGFTVSPLGRHSSEMGTGNHVILFEKDYLELLGVLDVTDFSATVAHVTSRREGAMPVAFRTDDARAAVDAARAAKVATSDPQTVRRMVALPDGGETPADFTIAYFSEVTSPFLRLFCSQIHTPKSHWIGGRMVHANTAWGISDLTIEADAPEQVAWEAARVLDTIPQTISEGLVVVQTGGAPIRYATQAALARLYPSVDVKTLAPQGPTAVTLNIADAPFAKGLLGTVGVEFLETDTEILVPPAEACGLLIALRETKRPVAS